MTKSNSQNKNFYWINIWCFYSRVSQRVFPISLIQLQNQSTKVRTCYYLFGSKISPVLLLHVGAAVVLNIGCSLHSSGCLQLGGRRSPGAMTTFIGGQRLERGQFLKKKNAQVALLALTNAKNVNLFPDGEIGLPPRKWESDLSSSLLFEV